MLPITVSDGPAGVRGTEVAQAEHSASTPSPTAAAAWDTELMERVGRFFAVEARRKDVDVDDPVAVRAVVSAELHLAEPGLHRVEVGSSSRAIAHRLSLHVR